jgi:beta-lactamase regulating signal transducer with metallopeptidase domain
MIETIITSTVLIAVVILLRALLSPKISKRLQYALWGLVLLRLLLPVGLVSSPVSVMNLFGADDTAPPTLQTGSINGVPPADAASGRPSGAANGYAADAGAGLERTETTGADVIQSNAASAPVSSGVLPEDLPSSVSAAWITPVWLTGSALFALWLAAVNVRFRLRLRRNRVVFDVPDCRLPVYVSPDIASPCLAGVFCPAVYLTPKATEDIKAAANGQAVRFILAHELAHYRQGDHIWSVLRGVCLALYWWNPLVWAAASLSRSDSEMACDEAVVRALGEGSRLQYSRTLVDMTAVTKHPSGLLHAAATMTSGGRQLQNRLHRIVKGPKTTAPAAVALILAAVFLAGCTFTGAQKASAPPEDSGGVSERAQTLFDLRNPYIGDAVADGKLLAALDIRTQHGAYTLELETGGEPYVLRLVFSDAITDTGAFNSAIINDAIVLLALIDNASEIQWEYQSGEARGAGTYTGSLTAADAAATMNVKDIKAFGQSADKVQALLDSLPDPEEGLLPETASAGLFYTVITLARGEAVSSYGPLDHIEAALPEQIITDALLKSAAWTGIDITTLDVCYQLQSVDRDGIITDYYAFLVDGKAVLQAGKNGMYTRITDSLYQKLVLLAEGGPDIDRTNLEASVSDAILLTNRNAVHPEAFSCESHVTLKTVENGDTTTVYAMVLYLSFTSDENGLAETSGSHMPAALTFDKNEAGEYTLSEYWRPQDGSAYMPSIKKKFPADITAKDIDTQRYITAQMRACYAQAVPHFGIETNAVIGKLFDIIASSPSVSSNPQDYIDAHPIEFRELLYYGDYTLRYIFSDFLKGGQTGLKGHLMLAAMTELLGEEAKQYTAASPQDWFDQWKADNEEKLGDAYMQLQPEGLPAAATDVLTLP